MRVDVDAKLPRTITVGGLPGTGTSTLCRLLRDRLGMRYEYAGAIFREEAKKYGMGLPEFGTYCESNPQVDMSLDDMQAGIMLEGNVIMEGRLAGWLARKHGIPAFTVWVVCEEQERVRRLVERDGGMADEQMDAMRIRQKSEAARYMRYYEADLDDLTPYDLVLDSTHMSPDQLADQVLQAIEGGVPHSS